MASKNDVTGDSLRSKSTSQQYRDGWDRIFSTTKTQTKNSQQEKSQDPRKM